MFVQAPGWCRRCGQAPCLCSTCHGDRYLRAPGPKGVATVRCPACNAEPPSVDPPPPPGGPRLRLVARR